MPYAQTNYQQQLGTGPGGDTIADVGCFLTAFCNLLERYGEAIDPPSLNQYFIDHDDYIAEGSLRDLLGWGSISSFDGTIHPIEVGGNGWPPSNNAIVKFYYRSISHPTLANGQPNLVTHFCLVDDAAAGTILDSWDGRVKHPGAYGSPVAWAVYAKTDPVVVTPPPPPAPAPEPSPPPAPVITYTKLASPLDLVINKDTHSWALDFSDDAHAVAAAPIAAGTAFRAFGKAQRTDGDKPCYYMLEDDFGQADASGTPVNNIGVNTIDLSPAPTPTPPTPETPAPSESEAVNVPVTVTSWKDSFKEAFGVYRASVDVVVKDLDGQLPDQHLGHDTKVTVAGTFIREGQIFYRTVKSQNEGHWYGIPKNALVKASSSNSILINAVTHPRQAAHAIVDEIDKIAVDIEKDPAFVKYKATLTPRGKAVAHAAEMEDKVIGFLGKVNVFKRKYK